MTWTAADAAGNSAQDSTNITVTDNENPVVTAPGDIVVQATSAAGATVTFADATATDNSGSVSVAQTEGPASGSVFPVGTTAVIFEAEDPSGNTAEASFTVTVEFAFIGFLQPIENLPVLNLIKGGGVVPVKWRILDGSGGFISDLGVVASMRFAPVDCGSVENTSQTLELADVETTGKSGLRYDATDEQYVFNWKTSKDMKGNCYFFVLNLSDGTSHFASFKVK